MPEVIDTAFPVPVKRFLPTLKGTQDEIWSKLLVLAHGQEKHTPKDWLKVLDGLKS